MRIRLSPRNIRRILRFRRRLRRRPNWCQRHCLYRTASIQCWTFLTLRRSGTIQSRCFSRSSFISPVSTFQDSMMMGNGSFTGTVRRAPCLRSGIIQLPTPRPCRSLSRWCIRFRAFGSPGRPCWKPSRATTGTKSNRLARRFNHCCRTLDIISWASPILPYTRRRLFLCPSFRASFRPWSSRWTRSTCSTSCRRVRIIWSPPTALPSALPLRRIIITTTRNSMRALHLLRTLSRRSRINTPPKRMVLVLPACRRFLLFFAVDTPTHTRSKLYPFKLLPSTSVHTIGIRIILV